MLTLPQDLVILAVGAKPRGGPNNGKLPFQLANAIRGAVLVALTLAGRVEVAGGRIVVRDRTPVGDQDLDKALADLIVPGGVPVGEWMQDWQAGYVSGFFERMAAAGQLREETVWLLFIAKRAGYRLTNQAYFEDLRARLRAVVTGTALADPALTALGGLVHAASLDRLVFPGRENEQVRARLAELAGPGPAAGGGELPDNTDDPFLRNQDPVAHATHEATRAAMHASVHAAVSATVASHHHSGGSSSGSDSSSSHHHH